MVGALSRAPTNAVKQEKRTKANEGASGFRGAFCCGRGNKDNMQTVLECLRSYKQMKKDYTFTLKSGVQFTLRFTYDQFYHIIGLQHLRGDTKMHVKGKPKASVLKAIERGEITQEQLEADPNYSDVYERVLYFDYFERFFSKDICSRAYMFNPDLVPGYTLVKGKYLLCQKMALPAGAGYLYLFLGLDEDDRAAYICTFFPGTGNRFVRDQKWDDIEEIR